jgi:hypothetical protein
MHYAEAGLLPGFMTGGIWKRKGPPTQAVTAGKAAAVSGRFGIIPPHPISHSLQEGELQELLLCVNHVMAVLWETTPAGFRGRFGTQGFIKELPKVEDAVSCPTGSEVIPPLEDDVDTLVNTIHEWARGSGGRAAAGANEGERELDYAVETLLALHLYHELGALGEKKIAEYRKQHGNGKKTPSMLMVQQNPERGEQSKRKWHHNQRQYMTLNDDLAHFREARELVEKTMEVFRVEVGGEGEALKTPQRFKTPFVQTFIKIQKPQIVSPDHCTL